MPKRFENKTYIITGGASLIGLATARTLLAEGGKAVLCDVNEDIRAEVETLLGDKGTYLTGDVTEDSFLDQCIASATETHGGLNGFVNAAVSFDDTLLDTTRDNWRRALDINVTSAAMLTQKAIPHMKAHAGGAIVYIASISGMRAQPNRVVYPVTKAALIMLAKTAAVQLADKGIRVNTVSPGWTWSRNIDKRYGGRERADTFAAEFQALGRLAEPEEIASAATYLLSEEASFITGTDLAVDGGYSALGPEALGQPQKKFPVS
ncbi:MAG: SDR family oxidoreductase [Pseudomonadota bacterium]